jgi:Fe-S cluster biogenesis protein NfuA
MSGKPVTPPGSYSDEERIRALIEQLDAYIAQYHGGSVKLISYEQNTVRVHLGGACLGCPLSPMTLHGWVEGTIKQFFPQVVKVESD